MEGKNISRNESKTNIKNHPLLLQSLRGLIVGKSGCGKTTLLLKLLLQPGWLHYSKLSVFVRVCVNQNTEFWEKVLKNNCRKGWLWICLKIIMKYNKNKFQRVCWLKSWQKIDAPIPKSLLSVIFINRQTMCLTRKNCLQSKRISWYLTISCFRSRNSVKPVTFVEGIQIVIVCIWVKFISNCLVKQFEKMQISFVCFLKTKRILATTTTCPMIWRKNSSKNFANTSGRSHRILLWLIWPHQRTVGNTDRGLTNFIS